MEWYIGIFLLMVGISLVVFGVTRIILTWLEFKDYFEGSE